MIGNAIGPYQILAELGRGGMGEVYRARDTQLNRDVAIKVLPEAFAADADRLARFTREAQLLASLNHPNIAQIYGIEANALVMELVDGHDLSALIGSGHATTESGRVASGGLNVDDALSIARQIADALEAAHEQGIIHRDLKPQNIKVRPDGTVKVLDFGLAKALDANPTSASAQAMNSPTLTARMTQMGMILGTAAYMAPEQAKGKAVDRRADIWAFGVVVHEMLTGRSLFVADTIPETLAHVMTRPVDLAALPAATPRRVRDLLGRCLEKDPRRRLRDIGEARLVLEDPALATADSADTAAMTAALPGSRRRERLWMAATGLAVAAAIGVAVWLSPAPAAPPAPIRFALDPPDGTSFTTAPGFLSVSPDGRHVAFFTGPQSAGRLWVRSLDTMDARPVPAADGGWHVVWSPDTQSIVFTAGSGAGVLKRVDLAGGPARTLAEDARERAAWSPAGVIVFTPRNPPQRLMRVPEDGSGAATPATELDAAAGETAHLWPVFLPDGRRFIYLARNQNPAKSALFLASLDSTERTHLLDVHSMAELVPGFLVYHREGTVYAHPFDEASARFTGNPVPIVEDVQFNATHGRAAFGTSRTGLLVFRTGGSNAEDAPLSWVDRSGKVTGTIGQPAGYYAGALSPDGRRYVVPVSDGSGGRDLVMIDIGRNITSRFTSDAASNEDSPIWTNDGESVVFSSNRKGALDLYIKNAGGAAPEQVLLESPVDKYATAFSPDGKLLLFSGASGDGRQTWVLPLAGDATPYRLFPHESEGHGSARFSPDGKWVAYNSGGPAAQVFVQPFPPTGYREQISASRGIYPRWSADGREIVFVGDDSRVMIADVTPDGRRLRVSAPRELFQQRQRANVLGFTMDSRAERFLMALPPASVSEASEAALTAIANWPSLIRKK